jgi:hypothetical protein
MWSYLADLPTPLSFTLMLIGILAIVVISLKGKLLAKWGKNTIGLGGSAGTTETNEKQKSPPPTTMMLLKRSCADCLLILDAERAKYEMKMQKKTDRLLTLEMNFIEQKLIEFEGMLLEDFNTMLHDLKKVQNIDAGRSEVEYKLYYGLLREGMGAVKGEFRRACKENGFHDMNEADFANYIKDRVLIVLTMLTQHLRNIYPMQGVLIPIYDIIVNMESQSKELHDYIFNIFLNVKQIIKETNTEIDAFKKDFSTWVENFVRKEPLNG